jgi:hypothetical protein
MKDKANRPPAGEPWVRLTRELIRSDAWRSLSINTCRLISFLMLEHMNRAGRHNGKLKAPDRHLRVFGIGKRHVSKAIREAEELGLVECHRGGMRVASTYTLTWLPGHDGTAASNDWRTYRNPRLPALPAPKSKNLPPEGRAGLPPEGGADGSNLPPEGGADGMKNLPPEGRVLLRKILPGRLPIEERKTLDEMEVGARDGASGEPEGASPARHPVCRAARSR